MVRIARVVAPGFPHLVTQRGNRGQTAFFGEGDYQLYIELMAQSCGKCGVEIWAYCLMPNHVHLIAAPSSEEGLAQAIGQAHVRYCRHVNLRQGWRGYLWQGRFASFVMDKAHLLAAARHVEMNPVRAKLAADPLSYRWSSARAHVEGRDDALVRVKPLVAVAGDWREFLAMAGGEGEAEELRRHERTGRPLGDERFLRRVEKLVGRVLHKRKPGPQPKAKRNPRTSSSAPTSRRGGRDARRR